MDDGVATVGVDGKVALLAGVDVDTSVSVNTNPAQDIVIDTTKKIINVIPSPPPIVAPAPVAAPAPVKKAKKKVDKIIGGITGGKKHKHK
jgi:hypothetical protein